VFICVYICGLCMRVCGEDSQEVKGLERALARGRFLYVGLRGMMNEEKDWDDEMMGVGTRHEEGRRWMALSVG